MRCQLYDAAGNRILWLDAREGALDPTHSALRRRGAELARRIEAGQELTAVLFGSGEAAQALFWNPDGTYEAVCGNALRCFAHFAAGDPEPGTLIGVKTGRAAYFSRWIDASHGAVVMPERSIHVLYHDRPGEFLVDVGTPHRIRVVEQEWCERDVADAIACSTGPAPTNFSLVRRVGPRQYRVRIFERGVGETASCGTAAVSVVAALNGSSACTSGPSQHCIEFDSGRALTVLHDPSPGTYEIAGPVALLRQWTAQP